MDAGDQPTHIVPILDKLAPDEQLAAVGAGLEVGTPAERSALTARLLELASDPPARAALPWTKRAYRRRVAVSREARSALILYWNLLSSAQRIVALALGRGQWKQALDKLDEAQIITHGESLAQLALDTCDPALVEQLPIVLEKSSAAGAILAAQTLLATAMRLTDRLSPTELHLNPKSAACCPVLDPFTEPWTHAEYAGLLAGIVRAVAQYNTHRRKEVLLAAIVLLESPSQPDMRGGRLTDAVHDPQSQVAQTLRAALARAKAPIARERALLWMGQEAIAASCIARFARAPSVQDHALVLARAHLGLVPGRRASLGLVPISTRPVHADELPPGVTTGAGSGGRRLHREAPVPSPEVLRNLDIQARRQVPRLIEMLDADTPTKRLALDPYILDPDPITRLAACRISTGMDQRDYCFDKSEYIARYAANRLSAAGIPESDRLRANDSARAEFASKLSRSPHATVRKVGREEYARLTAGLSTTLGILAAHRARQRDGTAFADWVHDRVRHGTGARGVGALMLCRRIGALDDIHALLLGLVRDSMAAHSSLDPRLGATAVACLGTWARLSAHAHAKQDGAHDTLQTPTGITAVMSVLTECMVHHHDARVRANATEAVGRLRQDMPRENVLLEVAQQSHHRVRASALRALLLPHAESQPGVMIEELSEKEKTDAESPHASTARTFSRDISDAHATADAAVPSDSAQRQDQTSTHIHAISQLASMLYDTSADHRLAGVWVVQRTLGAGQIASLGPWRELTSRVRQLAHDEPEPAIRTRASAVAHRLDCAGQR